MDEVFAKSSQRSLLAHFATIPDPREPCKVRYPLSEVLLLCVCATIAGCDDYDEIAAWGEAHLEFLREMQPYYWGVPCEDWLRAVVNRIDPELFRACFEAWVAATHPGADGHIAIDGKTSRGSHDRKRGQAPLHLVSAWASGRRLVLAQEAVADKSNEITAIPLVLERLNLNGALVTIDAIGTQTGIAEHILEGGGHYLLALKKNWPAVHADVETFFGDPPPESLATLTTTDGGHGRIEVRRHAVCHAVDWLLSDRRYPGEPRLPGLAMIGLIDSRTERDGKIEQERRYFLSSAPLDVATFAATVRDHWHIENRLHWVLDVVFREDQSRLRRGHGARNMAIVRHFALNLLGHADDPPPRTRRRPKSPRSLKTRRKLAGWNTDFLRTVIGSPAR